MRISEAINVAFNEQIGHELGNANQYLAVAAYLESESLALLAKLYYDQAEDEREHALKFVKFLLDAGAKVTIPAIPAPKCQFESVEQTAQLAFELEVRTSGQIDKLLALALAERHFAAQAFLQPFISEQFEEVAEAENMLSIVRRAGPSVLMVEAYLVHVQAAE